MQASRIDRIAQAVILIVIAIGYVGLTWYALIRWNSEVSSALITGFVLMAQQVIKGFIDYVHLQTAQNAPDRPTAPIAAIPKLVLTTQKPTEGETQ